MRWPNACVSQCVGSASDIDDSRVRTGIEQWLPVTLVGAGATSRPIAGAISLDFNQFAPRSNHNGRPKPGQEFPN